MLPTATATSFSDLDLTLISFEFTDGLIWLNLTRLDLTLIDVTTIPNFFDLKHVILEGPEPVYYVCLSVRLSVRPCVCLSVTPAVGGVRGADEQQKLTSVPRTLYVFNWIDLNWLGLDCVGLCREIKMPILNLIR